MVKQCIQINRQAPDKNNIIGIQIESFNSKLSQNEHFTQFNISTMIIHFSILLQ